MLLGLWMLMVCSPVFFIWTISWDLLILLILEDLQVVFEELNREYLVSKVIQGGLALEGPEESRTTGQKTFENLVFLCLGGDNSNMFFSFSPLPGEMVQFD